jgi:CheY-like chemotaxis protein
MTGRSILLVEDNPDDVTLTLRALKKNSIPNDVTVAHDGAEALDILFPDGGGGMTPGVILLDLNLPRVSGLEVLRRTRSDTRTRIVPVVVLTSSRLDDDVLASYHGGANAYVRKPVSFADFSVAVGALGVFWLQLNQTAPDDEPYYLPTADDEDEPRSSARPPGDQGVTGSGRLTP